MDVDNIMQDSISLNDIVPKLLILIVPAVVALLFSLVYVLIKSSQCKSMGVRVSKETYKSYLSVIFAINITGVMYAIVEALLIITENVSYDKVNQASMLYMLIIGLLCAVSGILKAVIAGNSLIKIANDTSGQNAMSRLMVFLAVAEIPAIASLAMFVIKFFAK